MHRRELLRAAAAAAALSLLPGEAQTGLDAIDAMARQGAGQPFSALTGAPLVTIMTALDVPSDRTLPAVRGYQRAKGLVIHGYFTSERVQKDVLKNEIMPGRFVGDAPMPARSGAGRDE